MRENPDIPLTVPHLVDTNPPTSFDRGFQIDKRWDGPQKVQGA